MSVTRTNEVRMLDDIGKAGFTFDSVEDMKQSTAVVVGQKVRTLGYYAAGDGGGNDYEIVAAATSADDGGSFIDLVGSGTQAAGLFFNGRVNPLQFGAIGDGGQLDESSISALDSFVSGAYVDLIGKTYLVSDRPTSNIYFNGRFLFESEFEVGLQELNQPDLSSLISGQVDTGGTDSIYDGGPENTPTVSGRTNRHNRLVMASQNCRSSFVRSANIASIYSHAFGNVSGNYSARQSNAGAPQSVNMASEECEVYGFRGANIASIFSRMVASTCATIASRFGFNHTRHGVNLGSNTCRAGFGRDSRLSVEVSDGVVSAINIDAPGQGYTLNDSVTVIDRQAFGSGATAEITSVDANGGVTGISVTNGGSGFTGTERPTGGNYVDAYIICEGNQVANIASELSKAGVGDNVANIASVSVENRGDESLIAASSDNSSTAAGSTRQAVIASNQGIASGNGATVLSGQIAEASHDGAIVMGRRVASAFVRSIVFGDAGSGGASTANRKFQVTAAGNVTAAGTITGSESYADYAEYFENLKHGEIPVGTPVTLEGGKVRPADQGEFIVGVVSRTAIVAAGDSPFQWSGRWLKGEFGEVIYEKVNMVKWEHKDSSYDGPLSEANHVPSDAVHYIESHPKENLDYNPSYENIPRSERPSEWTCVGMMGQVHVRTKEPITSQFVGADGKCSEKPTRLRVMVNKKEYNHDSEYGVTLCVIL